jgi:hypothetical protein
MLGINVLTGSMWTNRLNGKGSEPLSAAFVEHPLPFRVKDHAPSAVALLILP